jgi:DNA-binding NarL/FixJ family response regulator
VGTLGGRRSAAARALALACAFDERAGGAPANGADAVRALASSTGFDRQLLDSLAVELGAPVAARIEQRPAGLTEREVEVLRLAAAGHNVREIGRRLVISHHTARHHIESAYAKIGCSSRAAAALFAAEHGLLD